MEKHLNELGKVWKYGVWISHELSPHQLQHRVDDYMNLMTSHCNYQWLRNLIAGDEKCVLYINYTHRRQWLSAGQTGVATPKTDPHPKMVMLSVWWRANGIGCGSFKVAYRTRSSIDFTGFSRAAWVLSYCGGKTSERIRQDMEIWSLDTARIIITSASTQG